MHRKRLLSGLVMLTLVSAGAAQADPWKNGKGHGPSGWRGGDWKEEYWDGACKVERKWRKDGGYKEERKCNGARGWPHAGPVVRHGAGPGVLLGGLPMAVGPMPGIPGLACNRDLIGGLLGGAAGGLIGSQIGQGDGNTAATIGGAVLGTIVGGSIGRGMDRADVACVGQALEHGTVNQPVTWLNPNGGQYRVVPTRAFEREGAPCREYETWGSIGGQAQRVVGTACRGPDGAWRALQ